MNKKLPGFSPLALCILIVLAVALAVGVGAVASKAGPLAAVAVTLSLFTLPSLVFNGRVFCAYPNKTINDGPYGSFMADGTQTALGIYVRCKFYDPAGGTPDGKPLLRLASATERADVVTMQPIAAGAYGTVKFINCGGEVFGQMTGNIASGTQLYAAASGKVSSSSAGSALKVGMTTSTGNDGGAVTYAPAAQTT